MSAPVDDQKTQASLSCLLDTPELLRVRIRPAEFARALGVSKQSVSRWIRDGWVMLAADGRLDPVVAIGQLLRRCDPGRLRARWLRQAITDVQALREAAASADARVAAVEAALTAARQATEYEAELADRMACTLDRVLELLVESELALRATSNSDEWRELIERIDREATNAELDDLDAEAADALDALTARDPATQEGGGGE
jgi:hypothetical protein